MSRYAYGPCRQCGQRVAHTKNGRVLHSHRKSAKCIKQAAARQRSAMLARAAEAASARKR